MTRTDFSYVLSAFLFFSLCGAVQADDRHAGYYYATPEQVETYQARARVLPDASPLRRIGFVTAITVENNQRKN
jgi:hypothetical protein